LSTWTEINKFFFLKPTHLKETKPKVDSNSGATNSVVVIKNFDNSVRDARPESATLKRPTTAVRKRPSSGLGKGDKGQATATTTTPITDKKTSQPNTNTNTNNPTNTANPALPSNKPKPITAQHNIFEIHPVLKELSFLLKPKCLLDAAGDRFAFVTNKDQQRGHMPYFPPVGWTRYGINIKILYPNLGEWLAKDGNAKEWAVGYHGFKVKMSK
jgi:hypothetical protein